MIIGDAPAEQRQIIQQTLRNESAGAVMEEIRLRIPLRQLLVAVPHHEGQMTELGSKFGDADSFQRRVERQLPGVEDSRSSPRKTWVIFIIASSTGLTSV